VWAGSRKGSGVWERGRETSGRGRIHGGERGRLGGGGGGRFRLGGPTGVAGGGGAGAGPPPPGPTGGAHGRESASEQASVLTSRARRTERASVRAQRELASIGRPHRAARGREGRERARDDADRRGPLVREGRTHGRGMTGSRWACWARIGFPFSWNF
jgi:translation initiation factor IF-2